MCQKGVSGIILATPCLIEDVRRRTEKERWWDCQELGV